MGRLSDAAVNNLLDVFFGAQASTAPATIHVGLSTTLPTNAGANVSEPSGGSYARSAVTNNATNWPAATARTKSNGVSIPFPTASGSWGTVGWFVLYSASTGGTFLGWGALSASQVIGIGSTPDFPIGALIIDSPGA